MQRETRGLTSSSKTLAGKLTRRETVTVLRLTGFIQWYVCLHYLKPMFGLRRGHLCTYQYWFKYWTRPPLFLFVCWMLFIFRHAISMDKLNFDWHMHAVANYSSKGEELNSSDRYRACILLTAHWVTRWFIFEEFSRQLQIIPCYLKADVDTLIFLNFFLSEWEYLTWRHESHF